MRRIPAIAGCVLLLLAAVPAAAQLVGDDTAPGDSCAAFAQGATRMTADPDHDGANFVLVCDGSVWQAMSGSGIVTVLPQNISVSGDLTPSQLASSQNNYAPDDFATSSILRLSSSTDVNITGLAGGSDGRTITIFNVGSNTITLKNQSGSSSDANRFAINADIALGADQSATLIYDATSQRWRSASIPFSSGGTPCTDNATITCLLNASRATGDPQFTASNIASGVNILGVTGTLSPVPADPSTYVAPVCARSSFPLAYDNIDDGVGRDIMTATLPAGSYIFTASGDNGASGPDIYAYTFNGVTLTRVATFALPSGGSRTGKRLASDGAYIYLADEGTRVYALSFDGTSFTSIAAYNAGVAIEDVFAQGGYIYLALGNTGVRALTFNGSAWTALATWGGSDYAVSLAGDGTNVFLADFGNLRALNFNGSAWSSLATYGDDSYRVASNADGTRIFLHRAGWLNWSDILSFNGSSFTQLASFTAGNNSEGALIADGYFYASGNEIAVFQYAGGLAHLVGMYPGGGSVEALATDGSYLYSIRGYDDEHVVAFSFCGATVSDNTPDTLVFSHRVVTPLSTLVSSNIARITGISGGTAVSITGDGSPEYRICQDSGCNTVLRDWGSATADIYVNQYLQLRLTSASSTDVDRTATVTVGTVNADWSVKTGASCGVTSGLAGYWKWEDADKGTSAPIPQDAWYFSGAASNDTSYGSLAWSNPGNAVAEDGSFATLTLSGTTATNYLRATNFGFDIPASATIDGIEFWVLRSRSSSGSGNARDNSVRLVKGGTVVGNNKAYTSTNWGTGLDWIGYGGGNDLWGTTWTPADINASNFGAVFAAAGAAAGASRVANVDAVTIVVHYTAPLPTYADLSGQGNTGTVFGGASQTTGKLGQALQLDGLNDRVSVASFNRTLLPATMTAWVNANDLQGCDGLVFSRDSTGSGINIASCEDSSRMGYHWNDNYWDWTGGPPVPAGKWFLAALVVESTKATMYAYSENGLNSATNVATHSAATLNYLRVGEDTYEYEEARRFNGQIDDVRIYDRALTAGEIAALYNAGEGCTD